MALPDRIAVLPQVAAFLRNDPGNFIEGRRVPAVSGETLAVFDPSSGEQIAQAADANAADVDRAVSSAHDAFHDGRWARLRPADRERILFHFAEKVAGHGEELAQLETLEQGKSIHISRAIEVNAGVEYMRYVAGLATKITGQTLDVSIPFPTGARYMAYTRRAPVGVVAAITPWNFPLMIALWKVMPALAAGCTAVLKPSELTPLTALRLAEIAIEAGIPAGVLNVVTGRGAGAGRALVAHRQVSKISFTGSTATGREIGKVALDNMTRFSLELGGKNPAVVLADADLATAIPGLMAGAFLNQGQVCAACSRIYVEAPIHDQLVDGLQGAISGLSLGPGLDPGAQVNPLVSAAHQRKVLGYLEDARARGADLVEGAAAPNSRGYYVRPTLVLNPDDALKLSREEVFGPVLAVTRVADAETALRLANDTPFGLAASLWTSSLKAAMDYVPRIEAGTVWVNSHVPVDPNLPFGGCKQSGIGRDFGTHWLDAYTELKSVCIAH